MRVKLLAALISLAALMIVGGPAFAQGRSGQLRCTVAGGFGLFVTSGRATSCVYYRPDGAVEFYLGQSSHYGVDVGPTNAVRLAYHVVGANPTAPGLLAGNFAGVGLAATVGSGIGGDALVGGVDNQAKLLPIGNQALTGLSVEAGVSVLSLRYAGSEPGRRDGR